MSLFSAPLSTPFNPLLPSHVDLYLFSVIIYVLYTFNFLLLLLLLTTLTLFTKAGVCPLYKLSYCRMLHCYSGREKERDNKSRKTTREVCECERDGYYKKA